MKRRILAGLFALTMALSLAGCGSSVSKSESAVAPSMPSAGMMEDSSAADMGFVTEEYKEYEEPKAENGSVQDTVVGGQKLIRRANIQLETMEFDASVAALNGLIAQMGGYLEYSDVSNRSGGYRWASFTARIPEAQYEEFLNQAGQLCHETWRSTSQEDISEVYYDTAGRLETQQIKLERLQDLLSKAENMEDIIVLENAISETEERIDSLSGTLKHYDGKVSYATISISLNEVYRLTDMEEAPVSFGGRIASALRSGWDGFVDGVESLIVALAYGWVWVLVLAVLGIGVIGGVRKRVRRRREKAQQKAQAKDDNTPQM